jgi:endonuclease/exonuclease/phosphatase family metal-dependent hydrolase
MCAPRKSSLALLLVLALAACNGGGDPTATRAALGARGSDDRDGRGPPGHSLAGGNKVLPVMTWNLYLGADLDPAIAATDLEAFLTATTSIWSMVNINSFALRAEGVADEIAEERPALVGLQEAYVWTIQDPPTAEVPSPEPRVAYDYVELLVDALAARGLTYRPVASVTLFHFATPIATGETISLTDHEVILAREDVHTSNPVEQVFSTLLPLEVLGQPLQVERGWVSVDVKYRGEQLRFVSTHLEAFDPAIRVAQAAELAAALATETKPIVLVGDLNSTVDEVVPQPPPADPLPGARMILGAAGFEDTWALLHPEDAGLTCCFPEDLREDAPLETRVDYVLFRGLFAPRAIEILGASPEEKVSGLWPSDHAGLAATLRILDPRFHR